MKLLLTLTASFLVFLPFGGQLARAQDVVDEAQALPVPRPYNALMERSGAVLNRLEQRNNQLYLALKNAYHNNPEVLAARKEFLVVTEQLPQAESGYKPTIGSEANVTYTDTETKGQSFITSDGGNTAKGASVSLSQPLFRGGSTVADIKGAKNTIKAQLFALSAVEQNVLYDTAVAYMDVLRDMALVELRQHNHSLLDYELARAQSRFEVGELTRTDVSQSKARLAQSYADLIDAQGDLRASRAVYQQMTKVPVPQNIAFPAVTLNLPQTLSDALEIALGNNRDILQAQYIDAAAQDNIDSRLGALMPQLSAQGQISKNYDPSDFIEEQDQSQIGVTLSIPLYEAGKNRSRLREAKKQASQRSLELRYEVDRVEKDVRMAWESWEVAKATIKARREQIKAAEIAKEGVLYETEFGERTTLDALNATQELLEAQIDFVTARRDEVVASFNLARLIGWLVPQNLGFETAKIK